MEQHKNMSVCIFTTYNYQDGEDLIKTQSEQFVEVIKDMGLQFWALRYNLPKRYMSEKQSIEHGLKQLLLEHDIIIFVPVHSIPISREKLNDVIEKCKHGFVVVDGDAFALHKDNHNKLLQKDCVDDIFTTKVVSRPSLPQKVETNNCPELFNPFGCSLLKHKVPNEIFSILENQVQETKSKLSDETFVNENHFNEYLAGKNSYQIKVSLCEEVSNYLLSLSQHYIEQTKTPHKNIKMGSVWINYSYTGDFNPIHTHDSLLSGTIYIHQDDSVMQEMKSKTTNGRDTSSIPGMTHFVHDLNYHPFNKFSYSNKFVKGEMVMFPSWLSHWVNPFRSDGERITIAFNILES